MTDGLCDAPGERSFTDRLLGRPIKPCGKRASRWGMDLDLKPVEMCKPCWFYYTTMVEQHKMPQPKLKCHTCGKEIVLDVAEAARVLEMLDNRDKKRDKDPLFTCLDCKELIPLSYATVADHCRVLFNWKEAKSKEVVSNA